MNTASNLTRGSPSDRLIRSPSPFSRATENSSRMASVITPSPNSRWGPLNEKVDSSQILNNPELSFAEGDGEWRAHGKIFRSNIILDDEESGGNMFALSDSCAIERYYRVADRVLEQFLSSNIAERNELIECYIVGNRLFKFLSVVLPTHHQYFSSDPKLEKLRNCSESQLMELLEYMEELELMIDEMEYNRYILQDLTPSEAKDDAWGWNIETNQMLQEGWAANGNFTHGMRDMGNRIKSDNATMAFKQGMSTNRKQGSVSETEQQNHLQRSRYRFDHRNDKNEKIVGGDTNKLPQPSKQIKSNSAYTFDSQGQHEMLKQRVAAVVKANSSAEKSTKTRETLQSTSSGETGAQSDPFSFPSSGKNRFDSFPDMSFDEFQEFPKSVFEHKAPLQETPFTVRRAVVQKNSSEQELREEGTKPLHVSLEDSQMSWDADFSQFNVFSSEKSEDDDFLASRRTSNIDLILQNPSTTRSGKQVSRSKRLPKIKEPPVPYPRSGWGHAQVHAARLSSSFEGPKPNENEHDIGVRSAFSDCSSDVFHSLEDSRPKPEPVKTRIEERLERASRNAPSNDKNASFELAQYEKNSHRKLLNQFRGCVRSLLD